MIGAAIAEQAKRAGKTEAENADMKSRWMDWCDSHALDRIEALQAERDAMRPDAERWRVHVKRLEAFRQIKIDAQTTLP